MSTIDNSVGSLTGDHDNDQQQQQQQQQEEQLQREEQDQMFLELEQSAKTKEFQWILSQECPRVQAKLTNTVMDCLGYLSITGFDEFVEVDVDTPGYVPLFVQNESLKGYLVQMGGLIIKADLLIKMNKIHGKNDNGFETSIEPRKPFILHQIRDAFNFTKKAFVLLRRIEQVTDMHQSLAGFAKVIQNVMQNLVNAKHCLETPSSHLFPQQGIIDTTEVFSPKLPDELVIEMSINRADLVMRVFAFQTPQSKTAFAKIGLSFDLSGDHDKESSSVLESTTSEAYLESLGTPESSSSHKRRYKEVAGGIQRDVSILVAAEMFIGRVVEWEDTEVEVVDAVTFRYPLPNLKTFLSRCEDAILSCSVLLQNLHLLDTEHGIVDL